MVIDGLDELPKESELRFRHRMNQLKDFDSSIIVSCRTMYFEERSNWIPWNTANKAVVAELAPLTDRQKLELIENIVKNNTTSKSIGTLLEKNYKLNQLCCSPFVLTAVCLLFINKRLSEESASEKTNYASLYRGITGMILRGEWKGSSLPQWRTKIKSEFLETEAEYTRIRRLSKISWNLFKHSPSENLFTLKQWTESYHEGSLKDEGENIDKNEFWEDLESVGLISASGYRDGEKLYSFAHRTILEYFATLGLIENNKEEDWVKTITEHIWCETDWLGIIRFAASHTGNPDKLLQGIAKETGYATPPVRLLNRAHETLLSLKGFIGSILGILLILIIIFVGYFGEAREYVITYVSKYWQSLTINPAGIISNLITHPIDFIFYLANSLAGFYNSIFQNLISIAERIENGIIDYPYYLGWVQFTGSRLFILYLFLYLISFLTGAVKSIYYSFSGLRQDDIFRTGLRFQAEIIGYNDKVSDREIKRVAGELLESERTKSAQLYGASAEGGIPENLLLLFGSNQRARQILNDFWLAHLKKRLCKIQKANRRFGLIESFYGVIQQFRKSKESYEFSLEDFLSVKDLMYRLKMQRNAVSKYIYRKLSSETQELLEKTTSFDRPGEKLKELLVADFNGLLDDPTLYDRDAFQSIELDSKNLELLEQGPSGTERRHLNRLLLENAYPYEIIKARSIWVYYHRITFSRHRLIIKSNAVLRGMLLDLILFPTYWLEDAIVKYLSGLRNLPVNSDFFLVLRDVSVIPEKRLKETLENLLAENAKLSKFMGSAGKIDDSFTQLDIYAAKILAQINSATGKEKLVDFATRLDENNKLTITAIRELSLIDAGRAIRIIADCITTEWNRDVYYRKSDLEKILLDLPTEVVLNELSELSLKNNEIFHMVLKNYLYNIKNKTAKEWLKKVSASRTIDKELSGMTKAVLEDSMYKPFLDGDNWIESRTGLIKEFCEKGDFAYAAGIFNDLIRVSFSNNQWYRPDFDAFKDNLDKIASAASSEDMMEHWFTGNGRYSDFNYYLVLLATQPGGETIRKALVKWATETRFDNEDLCQLDWQISRFLALGEIKGDEAERTLLDLLKQSQKWFSYFKEYNKIVNSNNPDRLINERYKGIIFGLGKIGSDEILEALKLEANKDYQANWTSCYVVASILFKQNDPQSLEYLLKGKSKNQDPKWREEFGEEPTLRDFALRFKARITRIKDRGYWEYVAVSRSEKFKYRV